MGTPGNRDSELASRSVLYDFLIISGGSALQNGRFGDGG